MEASTPQLLLHPLNVPGLSNAIQVPQEGITLGRDEANQVVLKGTPYVSSFHARLLWEGNSLVIEDLGSRNGIFVNRKKTDRKILKAGDVIQFGQDGLRFAVTSRDEMDGTLTIPPESAPKLTTGLSLSRVGRLRAVMGIPSESERAKEVSRLLNRRSVVLMTIFMGALLGLGGYLLLRTGNQFRGFTEELEAKLASSTSELSARQTAWEKERRLLKSDQKALQDKIMSLEDGGKASAAEIQSLRGQLDLTSEQLDRFEPINLADEEKSKREKLSRALASITLIEQSAIFRNKEGTRYLHLDEAGKPFLQKIAPDQTGVARLILGTGSGFCVSEEGWILTNAHVVASPNFETPMVHEGQPLVMERSINVIFSGTFTRFPARIEKVADSDANDFALLKIEPFEGMVYIEGFGIDADSPSPGSTVTLFGFPLGLNLPQEEDSFNASVFAGIVSRKIHPYLQIQAAVYPGNSGGPVMDENGHVIGIVTAVQMLETQIASDIGYVLPIADVAAVWPPEELE